MTPEEIQAAAVRPLIRNNDTVVQQPQPTQSKPVITPVVHVKQKTTKVKIVGRSQYMRDMLTVE